MKTILIFIFFLIFLIDFINGRVIPPHMTCQNCVGKIHTKEELNLAKEPLVINKENVCRNRQHQLIVIVKTGTFERRNFTRHTWAADLIRQYNITILYATGYPKTDILQRKLLEEDRIYHDLLEFNFQESYYNLTIKTTSVLIWYKIYCSNYSQFLFYVDDDILVNVKHFMDYIDRERNNTDTIEGWFEKSGKIQRHGIGGVSKKDFPIEYVPDYLWGGAVLYPSNVISNSLVQTIFQTKIPIFFRDDVFINGFIAEQAGIKRKQMQGLLLYDRTEDDLKSNIILIEFDGNESRMNAWECYTKNVHCNKNLLLLLAKILCSIIFCLLVCIYGYKCVNKFCGRRSSSRRLLFLWFIDANSPFCLGIKLLLPSSFRRSTIGIQQAKLGIRWLTCSRKMKTSMCSVFIVVFFFYQYVNNN